MTQLNVGIQRHTCQNHVKTWSDIMDEIGSDNEIEFLSNDIGGSCVRRPVFELWDYFGVSLLEENVVRRGFAVNRPRLV